MANITNDEKEADDDCLYIELGDIDLLRDNDKTLPKIHGNGDTTTQTENNSAAANLTENNDCSFAGNPKNNGYSKARIPETNDYLTLEEENDYSKPSGIL